jgi:hypothetical protein
MLLAPSRQRTAEKRRVGLLGRGAGQQPALRVRVGLRVGEPTEKRGRADFTSGLDAELILAGLIGERGCVQPLDLGEALAERGLDFPGVRIQ